MCFRWDVQRFRALQVHETLEKRSREREEARLKGRSQRKEENGGNNSASFFPSADDSELFNFYFPRSSLAGGTVYLQCPSFLCPPIFFDRFEKSLNPHES